MWRVECGGSRHAERLPSDALERDITWDDAYRAGEDPMRAAFNGTGGTGGDDGKQGGAAVALVA